MCLCTISTNSYIHTHTQWNEIESDLLLVCAIVNAVQKHALGPFKIAELFQSLCLKQSSLLTTIYFFNFLTSLVAAPSPLLPHTCKSCIQVAVHTPQIYPSPTPILLQHLPLQSLHRLNQQRVGSWHRTARLHGRAPLSHLPVHPHQ